jgi:hypothetical protein
MLSVEERQVVELIGEGMARWGIAVRLDVSEDRVRTIVRRLCARFDCPMVGLPNAVGIRTIADDDDGSIMVSR